MCDYSWIQTWLFQLSACLQCFWCRFCSTFVSEWELKSELLWHEQCVVTLKIYTELLCELFRSSWALQPQWVAMSRFLNGFLWYDWLFHVHKPRPLQTVHCTFCFSCCGNLVNMGEYAVWLVSLGSKCWWEHDVFCFHHVSSVFLFGSVFKVFCLKRWSLIRKWCGAGCPIEIIFFSYGVQVKPKSLVGVSWGGGKAVKCTVWEGKLFVVWCKVYPGPWGQRLASWCGASAVHRGLKWWYGDHFKSECLTEMKCQTSSSCISSEGGGFIAILRLCSEITEPDLNPCGWICWSRWRLLVLGHYRTHRGLSWHFCVL